jgi:arylsulfatase A-like enzyme
MTTLLDLAGLEVPSHCEGLSMTGDQQRETLLGVHGPLEDPETGNPTRMLRDPRYKLVYYAAGNLRQLFDMREDPGETRNLAEDPAHRETLDRLSNALIQALPEEERRAWVTDNQLTGWPDAPRKAPQPNTGFSAQRGMHWPNN